MNKPNISKETAMAIIANAPELITKAMMQYVADGRLTKEQAEKYISSSTKNIAKPVMVIAIRGYYLNTQGKAGENDRGIYDDAMIVLAPNYFGTFNANTDPRKSEKGISMLLPGWHLFKQGWHGYGKPSGHKAFRTANVAEVLPVLRDGQSGVKDGHTINLHSGGFNNTNSAGCQTVYKGQWDEFQKTVYKLMDAEGQKDLPYLLVEERFRK